MYQINVITYLNQYSKEYSKIFTINQFPKDSLKNECTRIQYPKISPFKENSRSCIIVFKGENNNPLSIDKLDQLINKLMTHGYVIDYKLTKIMQQSKSQIEDLLFFIKKQ